MRQSLLFVVSDKMKLGTKNPESSVCRLIRIFKKAIRDKLASIYEVSTARILAYDSFVNDMDIRRFFNGIDSVISDFSEEIKY